MTSFSSKHHDGNSAIRNTGRHGSTYLMAVPLTPPRVACMTRVINASWRSSRSTPNREDVISTLFLDESVNLQPPEGSGNNTQYCTRGSSGCAPGTPPCPLQPTTYNLLMPWTHCLKLFLLTLWRLTLWTIFQKKMAITQNTIPSSITVNIYV